MRVFTVLSALLLLSVISAITTSGVDLVARNKLTHLSADLSRQWLQQENQTKQVAAAGHAEKEHCDRKMS